jgi:hypothetical protein
VNEIPRRCRLDRMTPAEHAIVAAVDAVEKAGAHPLLTQAVTLLGQARDKVADYVDRHDPTQPVGYPKPVEPPRAPTLSWYVAQEVDRLDARTGATSNDILLAAAKRLLKDELRHPPAA